MAKNSEKPNPVSQLGSIGSGTCNFRRAIEFAVLGKITKISRRILDLRNEGEKRKEEKCCCAMYI